MKYIIDYIVNFFDFIGDLFAGIGRVFYKFVLIVIHAGEFLISVINSLPTIIKVIAVGLVIVCIVYKILGREGGEAS